MADWENVANDLTDRLNAVLREGMDGQPAEVAMMAGAIALRNVLTYYAAGNAGNDDELAMRSLDWIVARARLRLPVVCKAFREHEAEVSEGDG